MRYWARYSDAVREAGLEPNEYNLARDEQEVLRRVVELARELGRFPTHGDLRVKRTNDKAFPSKGVFDKWGKAKLMSLVAEFCVTDSGNNDVAAMCHPEPAPRRDSSEKPDTPNDGFVYLIKSGRFYKIGKTNSVGRRERELAIQLPEQVKSVHSIKTDDPDGIEAYWHNRFEPKRKNGEWFDLSAQDVSAFRRRKFM